MKLVLVIGGNGFVGGHLVKAAAALGYNIVLADTSLHPAYPGLEYFSVDISNCERVMDVFHRCHPDLAINVAAIADIDLAERDHELAWQVNVTGAANCAMAARTTDCHYTWFSSDAVYNGIGRDFTEDSPLNPVNYYGQTKQMGEIAIMNAFPGAAILRLSLVLGFPVFTGNSFLASIDRMLANGQNIFCPAREVRTPIDVTTLCSAVYELDSLQFSGVLNLGSSDFVSRYDLACLLAVKLGYDPALIKLQINEDPERAPRHANGIISVKKAKIVLQKTRLKTVEETVDEAIKTKFVS
jgi:dTDP-4-dehydrorhamnose reductase